MRKSWWLLLTLSSACGHIKSDKAATVRDVSIDAEFKAVAEQRIAELDQKIADLQSRLSGETNDREALENELKQALFLKSWESIRSIQPCGAKFPNLTLNLGKRVAYPFTNVLRLNAPGDGNLPVGPLDPGEYFFAGHSECPFRVELGNETIDIIGQSALNLSTGTVTVQKVCYGSVCSSVLGDKKI